MRTYASTGAVACYVLFFLTTTKPVGAVSVGVFLYSFPVPNQFNGSNDTSTGTGCVISNTNLACIPSAKLTDGDIGLLHSLSMNLHRFFAWNRTQTQPVRMVFDLGGPLITSLSSVVLYFFNSPAQQIGFPIITLRDRNIGDSNTTSISYIYDNNDVLNESDSQLRNVSLRITNNNNFTILFIDFVFNDTEIDWFLLSEVEVCEGPPDTNPTFEPISFQGGQSETVSLGPNSPQSSVRLSCTVAVSGSFQWTWLHNSNPLMSADCYRILTADATRSSILVIDKLSYTDEGTYSCVVNHATQTDNGSRNIELELLTAVEAAVNQVNLDVGQNGTLNCEMYGYLRETIEWLKDGHQLQSVGRYNITTSAGVRGGQNGGQSSVSSVVSQLTIQQVQEGDEGTYTCRAVGSDVQDSTSINLTSSGTGVYTTGVLVAVLVYIVPILLLILVLFTIILVCIRFKKNKMSLTQGVPDTEASETTNEIIMSANPVYGIRPTSRTARESETQVERGHDSDVHVYDTIQ